MADISLCMIVKNEEAVLARCLDSVSGVADEIVIVDTGSGDGTKSIAARYTDLVYDYAWTDNFAAARNFSFSKATKDFILWLDADDVILPEDRNAMLSLKNSLTADTDAVMLRYNTAFDQSGKPVFYYYRERIVRRDVGFVWKGRVHEAIECSGNVVYSEIAVTHRSIKKGYSDRNLRIYRAQLAAGEPLLPRDRFYYGRELYYHGCYAEARRVLKEFILSNEGWVENNIEACKVLSRCCSETDDPNAALRALTESFRFGAPRADICCELGALFLRAGDFQTAAFWYELALQLPNDEYSGAFILEDCRGYLPCIQLCVCYDRLGQRQKAEEYNLRAGAYRPLSPSYLYNLKYFAELPRNA